MAKLKLRTPWRLGLCYTKKRGGWVQNSFSFSWDICPLVWCKEMSIRWDIQGWLSNPRSLSLIVTGLRFWGVVLAESLNFFKPVQQWNEWLSPVPQPRPDGHSGWITGRPAHRGRFGSTPGLGKPQAGAPLPAPSPPHSIRTKTVLQVLPGAPWGQNCQLSPRPLRAAGMAEMISPGCTRQWH